MIDICFLTPLPKLKMRAGMEYIDWQPKNFYKELTDCIKETYDPVEGKLLLSKADRKSIESVIKKYTNITVKVHAEDSGNLAIDAGFITPNSVLNNAGLDNWLSNKYTKISEAYKELKKNVLKGYCDLKTGKVEGDFKNIEFGLYINVFLPSLMMSKRYIKESGVTGHEAIAAGILHECGHAFFGLHYLSSTVIDNAMMMQTVKILINEPDSNRRAVIIKELRKETDIAIDEEAVKESATKDEVVILFEKGLMNRDYRRTLSLGVTEMTAEVLADAYAIRMGASHGLVGLLGSFYDKSEFWYNVRSIMIALIFISFKAPFAVILGQYILFITLVSVVSNFINNYVPGVYDTPYRRMKAILRENINHLSTNPKGFTKDQIRNMIENTKEIEKLVEKEKPFFESTAVQRTLGYVLSGSDFRKTDFEHYTAELVSSNLLLNTNVFNQKD